MNFRATGQGSPRNGMPPPAGYVYRGTGRDTLTGDLPDPELRAAAFAATGVASGVRGRGGRPATEGCGSEAAYRRHKRNGEDACGPCLAANAGRVAGQGARQKARGAS